MDHRTVSGAAFPIAYEIFTVLGGEVLDAVVHRACQTVILSDVACSESHGARDYKAEVGGQVVFQIDLRRGG